jgi:arginase
MRICRPVARPSAFDAKIRFHSAMTKLSGAIVRNLKLLAVTALCVLPLAVHGAATVKVDVIKQPYGGARNVPEISMNPDYIHAAGLERLIAEWGGELIRPVQDVRLSPEQDKQYGAWNRMALANSNMAAVVRESLQDNLLTVGLEANCNVLLGMLAGLKYDAEGNERRIGLVFIDAHGDFNVPETTLSGMLGGMPVAVAAGHALHNIRRTSGLNEGLPMSDIVWGGVRDLDPLEADRFREYEVQQFSVDDIRKLSPNLKQQMDTLSRNVDAIYVHIDMDVLDPDEVPGHDLAVADGPTSKELAAAMTLMFSYPKSVALGIASTPAGALDPAGVSRQAALNLIEGAIKGVQAR